jgi:hypothetical protein
MASQISERYQRFARVEARGHSPLYEMLAHHVADSPEAQSFLAGLPRERQQPNLLFASLRLVAGKPASIPRHGVRVPTIVAVAKLSMPRVRCV